LAFSASSWPKRADTLEAELAAYSDSLDATAEHIANKNAVNGYSGLDSHGHVAEAQNPLGSGLTLLDAYGHSYVQGGVVPRFPEGFVDRLANLLGAIRRNNRGFGGSIACWPNSGTGDGGYAWALQQTPRPGSTGYTDTAVAPYLPRVQLAVHMQTINDLGELGSLNPRPMQEAHRTIWSRIAAAALWEDTDAALVFTGTWTNNTSVLLNSGSQYKSSTTVGDKMVFTVPADYEAGKVIAVGLICMAAQDVTVGVKIGGVSQPDARLQGSVLCDQAVANKHLGIVLRFGRAASGSPLSPFDYPASLAAGTTIEVSIKSQGIAASSLNVDYVQLEADPLDGPVIAVPLPNKLPNYTAYNTWPHGPSAGTDPMNDAAVDSWKTSVQSVGLEFPSRMVFIDLDTTLVKTSADFNSDNLHPYLRGHGKIAAAIRQGVVDSGLLTSRVLSRSVPDPSPWFVPIGTGPSLPFQSSWTAASGYRVPGVYIDLTGQVTLKGAVTKTTGNAFDSIVNLNTGWRPLAKVDQVNYVFNGTAPQPGYLRVQANGVVTFTVGGSIAAGNVNSLEGMQFHADG
jgi:hypothetical protein